MVLARKARYLFKLSVELTENDNAGKGKDQLMEGYALLTNAKLDASVPTITNEELLSTDLLVMAAEAAVKNEVWDIAQESTETYFLSDPPKDQFYCRSLLCQSLVEAHHAKKCHGIKKVEALQAAISKIMKVITICMEPSVAPKYNFLIYNASVNFWNVARPLMRQGVSSYVVDSMEEVVKSLEEVKDGDIEWRM